jgi:hypothetical protein
MSSVRELATGELAKSSQEYAVGRVEVAVAMSRNSLEASWGCHRIDARTKRTLLVAGAIVREL